MLEVQEKSVRWHFCRSEISILFENSCVFTFKSIGSFFVCFCIREFHKNHIAVILDVVLPGLRFFHQICRNFDKSAISEEF